jgi:hypothetical protein
VESIARAERAEKALTEARAQPAGGDVELRRLRSELAAVKVSLAARESALTKARQEAENAVARDYRQTIAAELTKARADWDAELEQRLADAAAEAATELEINRAAWQAKHEERLAELEARAQDHLQEAHARWQQEAEAALSEAEEAWKADEAVRFAAAAAHWREQSEQALAEATARFEPAEQELIDAPVEAEAEGVELPHPRSASAVAPRTARGDELPEAQSATAPAHLDRGVEPPLQRLLAARVQSQKGAQIPVVKDTPTPVIEAPRQSRGGRRLVYGGALVAVLAMAGSFYVFVGPTILDGRWPKTDTLATETEPALRKGGASNQRPAAEPTQVAEQRTVIGTHGANLRAGPSTAAEAIMTLPRDTEVTLVERRGNWVLIRTLGRDGAHKQEGWVHSSMLKDATGS